MSGLAEFRGYWSLEAFCHIGSGDHLLMHPEISMSILKIEVELELVLRVNGSLGLVVILDYCDPIVLMVVILVFKVRIRFSICIDFLVS